MDYFLLKEIANNLQHEEEDLHGADDGEPGEKSQCSADGWELVNIFSFFVLDVLSAFIFIKFSIYTFHGNPIKCRSVEENSDKVKFTVEL